MCGCVVVRGSECKDSAAPLQKLERRIGTEAIDERRQVLVPTEKAVEGTGLHDRDNASGVGDLHGQRHGWYQGHKAARPDSVIVVLPAAYAQDGAPLQEG